MSQTIIKPYGDATDDGMMQLSFTLPIPSSPKAHEAAKRIAEKMGLDKVLVAHMEPMGPDFTFFVVYGALTQGIDLSLIDVAELKNPQLTFNEINELIEKKIGRKLVVIGACIGSDAHTVGIDAIFNMKGFAHDWGFERYPGLEAHNLRAQVSVEDLAKKVAELKADAVLVSRVVTQRDEHIVELKKFLSVLSQTPDVNPKLIKVCGGPRITHTQALSWGFDAGFGPGTKPSHVGSFIVHEFINRQG